MYVCMYTCMYINTHIFTYIQILGSVWREENIRLARNAAAMANSLLASQAGFDDVDDDTRYMHKYMYTCIYICVYNICATIITFDCM
jgi:hypothetical protein